jgi:hypothetical protein
MPALGHRQFHVHLFDFERIHALRAQALYIEGAVTVFEVPLAITRGEVADVPVKGISGQCYHGLFNASPDFRGEPYKGSPDYGE